MNETTIVAIATPHGEGGISVIRVSGLDAVIICDRIFRGKCPLASAKTHSLHYGKIEKNGKIIDEVLAGIMLAPHSYTGENVVEISCHGGNVVTHKVLSLILENGAVLATPGEFTKRAFLNGKLDLTQAEAVMDLIQAENESAAMLSVNQLEGKLSRPIEEKRKEILGIAAELDAQADFPDEGVSSVTEESVMASLKQIISELEALFASAEQGRLIRSGINTVIVGKPNVGKSSILNLLSGTQRALVTNQAGTTRDVIEERIRLGDVYLNLFDTAGIHEETEQIEALGIQKAKEYLEKADLVFFVIDSSRPYTKEDEEIASLLSNQKVIVLLNKIDIKQSDNIPDYLANYPKVLMSAKSGVGITELEKTVETLLNLGKITQNDQATVINIRHKQAVISAISYLNHARETLLSSLPLDLLSVDLRSAITALGEITGQTVSDEIVDEIFSRFCLGK